MSDLSLEQIREAHRLLAEFDYDLRPVVRGYAGRTLYINLTERTIASKPVTQQMKDVFTGGRGFCMWLLWNAVSGKTRWNDPENEIVISAGVIGGITQYPGTGKSTVVTISPLTHSVVDSNGGGYFGPYLKFAGWDALEIQGKIGGGRCRRDRRGHGPGNDRRCAVGEPVPGYWVIPPITPAEMTISFSGSFQRVFPLTAFHRSHMQNPRPPVNTSFICWVTGLLAIVPRSG